MSRSDKFLDGSLSRCVHPETEEVMVKTLRPCSALHSLMRNNPKQIVQFFLILKYPCIVLKYHEELCDPRRTILIN